MEKTAKQLSSQDWEQILQDFRREEQGKWLSQLPGLAILEQALYTVATKEYALKFQLLVFLEENVELLIGEEDAEEGLGSVVEALGKVVQAPADGVIVTSSLKEHMMTTATVAMVMLDGLHRAAHKLEVLVELLLGVINRPNHSVDRQMRGIACECLRELEKAYPCLLHACAGHMLFLCQSERTHVNQSYTLLLTTILHNLACYMYTTRGFRSTGAISFLSTAAPLVPFSVPSFLAVCESGEEVLSIPSRELAPLIQKEFKRVVGFLLERPQLLTPYGQVEFVSSLLEIAAALELHGSLLKLQFGNLMHTYSPLLCHVVLMIFSHFTDAFEGEEGNVFQRLILLCKEPYQPVSIRLLAMHWLVGLENLCVARKKASVLASLALNMYPLVFDPLSLKALKLDTLAYCAFYMERSGRIDQHVSLETEGKVFDEKKGISASELFKDGLICVSAFRWLPSWSTETQIMFRFIHRFFTVALCYSRTQALDFSLLSMSKLFKTLQGTLVSLTLQIRRLVPCVLALLDRLMLCDTHYNLGDALLRTFDRDLMCNVAPNRHLPAYFPIFERIAENGCIPPGPLLELLSMYIRNQVATAREYEAWKLWTCGSQVLGICRTVIVHHRSSRAFHVLSHLLAFLCCFFPDVEVRDSARIYLRMLISVPGNKLHSILKYGDERTEDTSASQLSHVSSLLRSPSLDHHVMEQTMQIASYIHLTRATPLLVRQSWSLVLHSMRQPGADLSSSKISHVAVADGEKNREMKEQTEVAFPCADDAAVNIEPSHETEKESYVIDTQFSHVVKVLQKYFEAIPDFQNGPGIQIKLHCNLSFQCEQHQQKGEDNTMASIISGPSFSGSCPAIYAIVISFFTSGPYGPIPSVHIPFLLSELPRSTKETTTVKPENADISIVQQQLGGEELAIREKEKLFAEGLPPNSAELQGSQTGGVATFQDSNENMFQESVIIELEPKQPVPTIIDSHIVTSDEVGRSMHGQLDSIPVGIEDLFMKVPIPTDILPGEKVQYCVQLFNALWDACGTPGCLGSQEFLLKGSKNGIVIEGTESVKLLECQVDRVVGAVEQYLVPFVVSVIGTELVAIVKDGGMLQDIVWQEDGETSSNRPRQYAIAYGSPTETRLEDLSVQSDESHYQIPTEAVRRNLGGFYILIFLPPRFHLLFKMDISSWSTLVHVRTDYWPCLAYVDEYLEALIASR
eukprot:c26234_g1_i1 orf=70-3660(+)